MARAGRVCWGDPVADERETLTYELFGAAARALARQVADDGFEPDLVLAIARGGLFLGGALGYALDVKNLFVMNVEFYTGVDERLELPVVLPPVLDRVDLTGARVLVTDDVADTGKTLELVRDFCRGYVEDVRTRGALREAALAGALRVRLAPQRPVDRLPVVGRPARHPPPPRRTERVTTKRRSPCAVSVGPTSRRSAARCGSEEFHTHHSSPPGRSTRPAAANNRSAAAVTTAPPRWNGGLQTTRSTEPVGQRRRRVVPGHPHAVGQPVGGGRGDGGGDRGGRLVGGEHLEPGAGAGQGHGQHAGAAAQVQRGAGVGRHPVQLREQRPGAGVDPGAGEGGAVRADGEPQGVVGSGSGGRTTARGAGRAPPAPGTSAGPGSPRPRRTSRAGRRSCPGSGA